MNIGVGGASGKLGQAVLRELQARAPAHRLIAISRTPEQAPAGVEGRLGDYDRPETLAKAYAGLDRLLLIPTSDMRPGMRGDQNIAGIRGAVAAGVKHIVLMSAAGTREEEEPAIGASYWRGEQELIKTAPKWTVLRMNYYAESLLDEVQTSAAQGALAGIAENRVAFVSRDDIAAAAAGILIGDGHAGAIYNATGSRSYTGAERAALISEVMGKPLGYITVPAETLRAGMIEAGLPDFVANAVVSIQSIFADGALDIVTGDIEKLAGRPPRELRDLVSERFKPSVN
ncbi:SDR family oxidoreductase [Devosia sp. LjRoot16]|uniref:SDR family oxidoreductase n=1 Tax=Devosia sp. LjRoot16 TaxID=3342271 RepID=UPI003ED0E1A2